MKDKRHLIENAFINLETKIGSMYLLRNDPLAFSYHPDKSLMSDKFITYRGLLNSINRPRL